MINLHLLITFENVVSESRPPPLQIYASSLQITLNGIRTVLNDLLTRYKPGGVKLVTATPS